MEERARRKDTGSHGAAAVPRGSHGTPCTPQALYRHFQADCLGVDRWWRADHCRTGAVEGSGAGRSLLRASVRAVYAVVETTNVPGLSNRLA